MQMMVFSWEHDGNDYLHSRASSVIILVGDSIIIHFFPN